MNSPSEAVTLAGEVTNGQLNNGALNNGNGGVMSDQQSATAGNAAAGSNASNSRANLIVNYLPQSIKEQDFNMLFSKIGPLKSCKLMFDRQTGSFFLDPVLK